MKKLITVILAAVMVTALFAGCGSSNAGSDNSGETTVDLTAFYTDIESKYELPSMMDLDADSIESFFPGLSEYTFTQQVMKTAAISTTAAEYVFLECASADDAAAAAEILQARADYQAEGGAWYPESMEIWSEAQVITNGNYAALIAGANSSEIADAFNALFTEG